jgi:pimeloyl-ACP methyl ester carboxylesterase
MGAADGAVFRRHVVTVNGIDIQYLRGGRGRPLLYLHGMGGGGRWESYHMALGNDSLTHAPILPGWPEGTPPAGIASVRDYAQLMAGFLDALELERVILVGHSIGGWIAQYLAVEHPHRVSRLVLVDALGVAAPEAPPPDLGAMNQEEFAAALFARLGLLASAQREGFGAVFTDIRSSPEFEREWNGRALVSRLANGTYADAALTERLAEVTAETLLIWGEADRIAPLAHAQRLRVLLPHAHLVMIEGAGHLPMLEKRETFHRLCRDFLIGIDEPIAGVVRR